MLLSVELMVLVLQCLGDAFQGSEGVGVVVEADQNVEVLQLDDGRPISGRRCRAQNTEDPHGASFFAFSVLARFLIRRPGLKLGPRFLKMVWCLPM
mgnify:CR=1 FL=1